MFQMRKRLKIINRKIPLQLTLIKIIAVIFTLYIWNIRVLSELKPGSLLLIGVGVDFGLSNQTYVKGPQVTSICCQS